MKCGTRAEGGVNPELRFVFHVEPVKLTVEETLEISRQKTKKLKSEKRQKNFQEVELGFDKNSAIKEAKRCLRCDLEIKKIDEKEKK